jgi:peptide/nickel transport system ATP-binding protein
VTRRPVLEVRDLGVRLPRRDGGHHLVLHGVSFSVPPGEVLAVVGESGAGKTMTLTALLGLLPARAEVRGEALVRPPGAEGDPVSLLDLPERDRRRLRGRGIAHLPQGAATALTPVRTVGSQLLETARALGHGRAEAGALVRAALERFGAEEELLGRYPHQLSGGQLQRFANAAALLGDPWLVLADEPTAGLDEERAAVTAAELRRQADEGRAVLVVTHDLRLAEDLADRVAVLYAGHTVETGPAARVLGHPRHPYTAALLAALPRHGLRPLAGEPPQAVGHVHGGCPFADRCPLVVDRCRTELPALRPAPDGDGDHVTACHRAEDLAAGALDRGPTVVPASVTAPRSGGAPC